MTPILVHYALTVDVAGYPDMKETVDNFIVQAGLTEVEKSVETVGSKYTIRFTIPGSETMPEMREAMKHIEAGLFSDSIKNAVKNLKERPDDIYLELSVRLPLYGADEWNLNS
jgi:hypothetical protein